MCRKLNIRLILYVYLMKYWLLLNQCLLFESSYHVISNTFQRLNIHIICLSIEHYHIELSAIWILNALKLSKALYI